MTKHYAMREVVKTLAIEIDREVTTDTEHIHFEFVVMIIKSSDASYFIHVYRNDLYELKPMTGDLSHENILVKDYFLVDDRMIFNSETDAMNHIERRLEEIFG